MMWWFIPLLMPLLLSSTAAAQPFVPENDNEVLEHLPYRMADPDVQELRTLRGALTSEPRNPALAVRLAERYIQLGRSHSDPRYYGYAQAALEPWWNLPEASPAVLVLRATLRQNRHEFPAALADLSRALRLEPRNARAWLTRAVILAVQGDYPAAMESCLPLLKLVEPLVSVACLSNAGNLSGQAAKHYALLRQTLASSPGADPETQRWALTLLAEIALRIGDPEAAEKHFQEALALAEPDAYLRAAHADFLLDEGRFTEVETLLKDETRIDGLLLRLALAEHAQERVGLTGHIDALAARFAANRTRGDTTHQGEEARFTLHLLDRPRAALQLAQDNWRVQREPRDARILLEAALAARDKAAAEPVLAMLRQTRLEDRGLSALARQIEALP
jgi:tetratricopeptide (TPR) repeat protein